MKQANQIKNSYNGYLLLLMLFSPIMGLVINGSERSGHMESMARVP